MNRRVLVIISVLGFTAVFLVGAFDVFAQTSTPTSTPTPTPTPTGTVTPTNQLQVPFEITFDLNGDSQGFEIDFFSNGRCTYRDPEDSLGNNPSIAGGWLRCTPRPEQGNGGIALSYAVVQGILSDTLGLDVTNPEHQIYIESVEFDTDWHNLSDTSKFVQFELEYEDGSEDTQQILAPSIGGNHELLFDGTKPIRKSIGGFSGTFLWVFAHAQSSVLSATGIDNVVISGYFTDGTIAPTPTPAPTITPTATITPTLPTNPTPTPESPDYEPVPYEPVGGEDDAPLGVLSPIDHGVTCLTLGPVRVGSDSNGDDVELGFELCLHQYEYEIGLLGYNFSTTFIAYASGILIVMAWLRTR